MNTRLSRVLVTGILTCTVAFTGIFSTVAFAEEKLDSGLYFNDPNGTQGEFYNFNLWSEIHADQQTNLILKYKPLNISIYLGVTNKIANLKDITQTGSFDSASKTYIEGNITGEYKNISTGEIINGTSNKIFEVLSID